MTAEDLRKSILQQAIQGKLVPQDPNDEPASVLLERIREEKARLVKEKKIKKDKNESIIYKGEDNSHYEKILATSEIKCIDDEIPFEIPNSWNFVRLHNLCWLDDGCKSSGEKLPYMDAKYHRGKSDIIYITQGKIVKPPCKVILVDGENSGEIFDVKEKGYLGSTFKVLQISKCISKEWLHMLLNTYRELFKNSKIGAAIPHLNKNLFRNLIVGLPPLQEQRRIVAKIEKIQPLIDKYSIAQEQAEEMDNALQPQLKKSILQYAIQGKLVPQIENEESASILLEKIQQEKLRLVKDGKLKKKDLDNSVIFKGDDNKYYEKLGGKITEITEEIPYELPNKWRFVRLSNLCWLDDGTKASGEKLPYLDAKYHRGKSEVTYLTQGKIVEPPCKAILVDGENSGEIFNITEKGYLGSTFKVLQISKCISEEWLHILLNTYRDLFKNSKVGAAIPHLNKNLFRNLIVGLPPLQEQRRIVAKIEKILNLR